MADARSLLRQQRAARPRLDHPQAAYTDAGKLFCALCSEPVKSEAIWEAHLRSASHRQNMLASQQKSSTSNEGANHKRRHSDEDTDMREAPERADLQVYEDGEAVRRKRSKTEMAGFVADSGISASSAAPATAAPSVYAPGEKEKERHARAPSAGQPPPSMSRRTSSTPALGVEMSIPSRPATPNSSGSTTKIGGGPLQASSAATRSPLIPAQPQLLQHQETMATTPPSTFLSGVPTAASTASRSQVSAVAPNAATVDEAEWAAFEADIASISAPVASYDPEATISAPALGAAQVAEREEEARRLREEQQRTAMERRIRDETEDAARAMEDEFAEMEELEARVRRLKEKREALRRESAAAANAAAMMTTRGGTTEVGSVREELNMVASKAGKENEVAIEEESEDEDEDEDEDEWADFRFRG